MDVELSGSQEPQLMVVLDRHTTCRATGPGQNDTPDQSHDLEGAQR